MATNFCQTCGEMPGPDGLTTNNGWTSCARHRDPKAVPTAAELHGCDHKVERGDEVKDGIVIWFCPACGLTTGNMPL